MNNQFESIVFASIGGSWTKLSPTQFEAFEDFKKNNKDKHIKEFHTMGQCSRFIPSIGITKHGIKYRFWIDISNKEDYIQLGDGNGNFHKILVLDIPIPTYSKDKSVFEEHNIIHFL